MERSVELADEPTALGILVPMEPLSRAKRHSIWTVGFQVYFRFKK